MPPLPTAAPQDANAAADCVVEHLRLHDSRFRGNSRRAKKNRHKAKERALKAFQAYESGGYEAVEGVIAGWFVSLLLGIALHIATSWLDRLVSRLIQDWLHSEQSEPYRSAVSARLFAARLNDNITSK